MHDSYQIIIYWCITTSIYDNTTRSKHSLLLEGLILLLKFLKLSMSWWLIPPLRQNLHFAIIDSENIQTNQLQLTWHCASSRGFISGWESDAATPWDLNWQRVCLSDSRACVNGGLWVCGRTNRYNIQSRAQETILKTEESICELQHMVK